MPFGLQETPANERYRQIGGDLVTAPLGQALGATIDEDLFTRSPTAYVSGAIDVWAAEHDANRIMLDPKTATQKYGVGDLTFDAPISEAAADLLSQRKRQQLKREEIIARSPDSFGANAARMATSFAAFAADPLNLASAFVPIVGEARYAAWAARYGKTAGRAAKGAVEGAVGAAMIEPVSLLGSSVMQDDYTLRDSALNITFGSILGGGLHMGVGALGDAIEARKAGKVAPPAGGPLPRAVEALPIEAKEDLLRTAHAQAMAGEEINISPVFDAAKRESTSGNLDLGDGKVIETFDSPDGSKHLVLTRDGSHVAEATVSAHGDNLSLDELHVVPSERGAGVGSELLDAQLTAAKALAPTAKTVSSTVENQVILEMLEARLGKAKFFDKETREPLSRDEALGTIPKEPRGRRAGAADENVYAVWGTERLPKDTPLPRVAQPITKEAIVKGFEAKPQEAPVPEPKPDTADPLAAENELLAEEMALSQEIADSLGLDMKVALAEADEGVKKAGAIERAVKAAASCGIIKK